MHGETFPCDGMQLVISARMLADSIQSTRPQLVERLQNSRDVITDARQMLAGTTDADEARAALERLIAERDVLLKLHKGEEPESA